MNCSIPKRIIQLLALAVLLPCVFCAQKNTDTDWQRRQLRGKVKILITKWYKIKDSTDLPVFDGTDTIWFNRHGLITKEIGGDSAQKPDYFSICNYDPTGKRLLRERNYNGLWKGMIDDTRYSYNAAGNCTMTVKIDREENSADRTKFFYDKKNRLTKVLYESSDRLVPLKFKPYFQNKRVYTYDSLDRESLVELFENNGRSANTTHYFYSDSINLIVTKSRHQDSAVTRMNDKGQMLSYRLFMRNSVYSGDDRTYDENGKLVKLVAFIIIENKKDEYRFVIHELDEKKNWKKEKKYVNGIMDGYFEQEIFYYK